MARIFLQLLNKIIPLLPLQLQCLIKSGSGVITYGPGSVF